MESISIPDVLVVIPNSCSICLLIFFAFHFSCSNIFQQYMIIFVQKKSGQHLKLKKNKNGKRCKKKKKRVEKCVEIDRNDQTYVVHWLWIEIPWILSCIISTSYHKNSKSMRRLLLSTDRHYKS